MKSKLTLLNLYFFLFWASSSFGQAATASLPTLQGIPGTNIVVPITVTNFNGIGAITMKIKFAKGVLNFISVTNKFPGFTPTIGSTDTTVSLAWSSLSPITISNGTLADLNFHYNGTTTALNFFSCAITAFGIPPINISVTYTNGSVSPNQNLANQAQIGTKAATASGALVSIPLYYPLFTQDAGALTQKIQYDPTKLSFQSITPKGQLAGAIGGASGGILTVAWTNIIGANIGMPGDSIILNFIYTGTTDAALNFAPGCVITTTSSINIPVSYFNGLIIAPPPICIPSVTTLPVSNIGTTTANSGGNVLSDGGESVTSRGICWSISPDPTITDSHTTDGSGLGIYTSDLTSLSPNTIYHLRAYATNICGTSYGDNISFTTACENIVPVSVTIESSAYSVCEGTGVILTAFPVNGGTSPTFQWKLNGTSISGATNSTYIYTPSNGDNITCMLTSNETCVSGNPATSNIIVMDVIPANPVSISISASANQICAGTSVTYTATVINGGTIPYYQWIVNSINIGTNSSTFTYIPSNGDQVVCELTSDLICPMPNPATSNMITMIVSPIGTVSVSIVASANPVCSGTSVTFNAIPFNGGSNPTYQWNVSGISIPGATNANYTFTPVEGDYITCFLMSNASCIIGNPAISNTINMIIEQHSLVNVSIIPSANPICTGTSVTYTATPTNGGNYPSFQWTVNGLSVGVNYPILTYPPANNDHITCVMTSNATCITGNPATSNTVTMTVNPLPVPIISGPNAVLAGTAGVTYSTEAGMTGYNWTISQGGVITNGAGTNTVTVTWNSTGAQTIEVNYTGQEGCTSASATILDVMVYLIPNPTITGPINPCINSWINVYSTESGMSGYLWALSAGGTIVYGGGSNDNLMIVAWTDAGAQWVSVNYQNAGGFPAPSPTILPVTVHPLPQPAITGNANPCYGNTDQIYTTDPGMNNYQWTVSPGGQITAGGTSSDNSVTITWTQSGQQTVSVNYSTLYGCSNPSPGIFNIEVAAPFVVGSITANQTINYNTAPSPLVGTAPTGGNIPYTYQWQQSLGGINFTDITGATNLTYTPGTLTMTTYYKQIQTSSDNCGTAQTNILTIIVNPQPFITIISPNGGEDWPQSSTQSITWNDNITEDVKIDLYKGLIFHQQISSSTPSTGTFSWTIPDNQIPGDDYKVKITSVTDNTVNDMSTANFSISSSVPTNLSIQNVTITDGQINCYNAMQTITIAGNGSAFIIQSGGSATMIAGQNIVYYPGTNVQHGGYLLGYIAPAGPFCVTPTIPAVMTGNKESQTRSSANAYYKTYPNPTKGDFTLEFTGDLPLKGVNVSIFGIRGEKVMSTALEGKFKHEFSLSNWPAGIYIIHVVTENQIETMKIIKQ